MNHNDTQDEEDSSELDATIRQESSEFDNPKLDRIVRMEANETDEHFAPVDTNEISKEAEEYDNRYVAEAEIQKLAEKYIEPNEKKYITFCNRVVIEASRIYDAVFSEKNTNKDKIEYFIRETMLEIDGRKGLFAEERTIDSLIRDYAIRDANITSKKLTPKERNTYNLLLAMQRIKQAIEKPAKEHELIKEAYEYLESTDITEIAQNINQIVQKIKEFYESE